MQTPTAALRPGMTARGEFKQNSPHLASANRPAVLTVGIVGLPGMGKSSTLNALFRTRLPTSPVRTCTTRTTTVTLATQTGPGQMPCHLRIVDTPGLEPRLLADAEARTTFQQQLACCHVLLWVMSAGQRAFALEQPYLQLFAGERGRMVFGLNQVDAVEPMDWDASYNIPSAQQGVYLQSIYAERRRRLWETLTWPAPVVCYSARCGYRLELLFHTLLEACQGEGRRLAARLHRCSYQDFAR